MGLFNFDEFKIKARETAGSIADASVELYKKAEEKATIAAKTAKLNAEITRDKGAVRRLYYELGKTYYSIHEQAEEALAPYCDEIRATLKGIEEKQAAIREIKGDAEASEDGIDIEVVTDEDLEAAEEECRCECGCEEAEAEEKCGCCDEEPKE